MNIAAKINFKNLKEQKTFDCNSAEYTQLEKVYEEGNWKEYSEQLISEGVSVIFDVRNDCFIVKPLNFNIAESFIRGCGWTGVQEPEEEIETDNIDIESGIDDLSSIYDSEDEIIEDDTEVSPQIETNQTNDNLMQVVTLEDVLSIIKNMGIGSTPAPAEAPIETSFESAPGSPTLVGGDEALKAAFFQGEGNETLDSEFDAISSDIDNIETHIQATPYLDVINGRNKKPEPAVCPMEPNSNGFGPEGISREMSSNNTSLQTRGAYNDDGDEIDSLSAVERFLQGVPGSEEDMNDIYGNDEPEQILLDEEEPEMEEESLDEAIMDEYDLESMGHPDLHRISGDADFNTEEDEDLFYDASDFEPDVEEPMAPLVTKNEPMNFGGQTVQIVLTGVMITPVEMNYIAETVKKAGGKLKKIEGVDNELKIVLEANQKQYTIDYIDLPKYKAPTPFSIKGNKFGSLEEALDRINFKRFGKETEVFKQIMTEGYLNREMNNWKDTDIFDNKDFNNINYVSSWNMMSVGNLNLKTGLNEAYSNITQHSKELNTLVKNEKGNYFLIKGNLKEMSKVGTKREMIDVRNKVNHGTVTVVGLYENTKEGLGEIMYEVKKTAIQLLIWK